MKRGVIICQSAPGGKRRLAEEAFRLAAGLSATGRFHLDFVLQQGGLLLLEPEFGGSLSSWESLRSLHTKVYLPSDAFRPVHGFPLHTLPEENLEKWVRDADFVLRF